MEKRSQNERFFNTQKRGRKMRDENLKPWDRQEGEGAKAYEAFCIYRDLGKSRSYPKVTQKLPKSLTIIKRWANANNWKTRADAWDRSITEEARQKAIKAPSRNIKRQLENRANGV